MESNIPGRNTGLSRNTRVLWYVQVILNPAKEMTPMSVSRRQFLKTSAVTASVPLLTTLNMESSVAGAGHAVDMTLGYEPGALRMNLNENPLGPPPAAVAAAQAAIPATNRYVYPDLLQSLLGEQHGMEKDWVLVGNGSTEILKIAPLAFARDSSSSVVSALETWNKTPHYAGVLGAKVNYVNMLRNQHFEFDIDGMLNAVDASTRIFFVVNPNNPTGAVLSFDELKRIADSLPQEVLFIIDEAYSQFNPEKRTGIDLLKAGYDNVLVTRTFSKAWGLAALRCGYAVGHPDILKKIAVHGCDAASLNIAGYSALQAALGEPEQLDRSRKFAAEVSEYFKQESAKQGLSLVTGPLPLPFFLLDLGERAKSIEQELVKRNIFVRHVGSWGLPHHIRVSWGLEADNQAFFRVLKSLI
jgi:histidinol-phosphate aminotransferase